jgi:hypothetical protein
VVLSDRGTYQDRPNSYEFNGKQYVTFVTGDLVLSFALPQHYGDRNRDLAFSGPVLCSAGGNGQRLELIGMIRVQDN